MRLDILLLDRLTYNNVKYLIWELTICRLQDRFEKSTFTLASCSKPGLKLKNSRNFGLTATTWTWWSSKVWPYVSAPESGIISGIRMSKWGIATKTWPQSARFDNNLGMLGCGISFEPRILYNWSLCFKIRLLVSIAQLGARTIWSFLVWTDITKN